jgi:ribonuclease HI
MKSQTSESDRIEIYTDGACSGNPGPGGYGALLKYGGETKEISGFSPMTTNNRMELTAVIKALEMLKRPCLVRITTDSTYVVKGMTEWLPGWIKRNWKNAQKKPVANRDLWERLLALSRGHRIQWQWIKGHDGHPDNERCDRLAREAIERGAGPRR